MIRVDASLEARQADGADAAAGFPGHPQFPGVCRPSGLAVGWSPWASVAAPGPGLGWRLVPDSDLVVTLHLKPGPGEVRVQPKVALWFDPQPPSGQLVTLRMANEAVRIPPGSEDVSARDQFIFPAGARLLALYPEGGRAARTFRLDLTVPDEEGDTFESSRLFEIPDWESGQQEWYRFQTPVEIPERGRLELQIRFAWPPDRSAESGPIRWGAGPGEELGEVHLLLAVDGEPELFSLVKAVAMHQVGLGIEGAESRIGSDPGVHAQLARLYADLGEPETAEAHGLKAVSLDDADARAHAALGAVYLVRGHDFSAQEHLEIALRLDPELAEAHYNLGNVFMRYGVAEKARASFQRAVSLDRRDSRYANNLGHLLLAAGETDQALEMFRAIVERNPYHAPATANLGRALEMSGHLEDALPHYRRAIALAPAMAPSLMPVIQRAEAGKPVSKKPSPP
jgi:Tfp pilus assembly protein PilF